MLRKILTAIFLFALTVTASAQSQRATGVPPYSGTAIGNGLTFTQSMFVAANSVLQYNLPIGFSMWIKVPNGGGWSQSWHFTDSGHPAGQNAGWLLENYNVNNPLVFFMLYVINPSSAAGNACEFSGTICTRASILNDGLWHHYCGGWDAQTGDLYIDGGSSHDRNPNSTNGPGRMYVPSTTYWIMGQEPGMSKRDEVVLNFKPSAAQCSLTYNRGVAGFSVAGTAMMTGAVAYFPWNNCTGFGTTLSCADTINGLVAIPDSAAPVVTFNTPSTTSGTIALSGTCTDQIACNNVTLNVNNVAIATLTLTGTAWSYNWDSTKVADGANTLTVTASNLGGATGSATISVTTTNGIASKVVYLDPTLGTDCTASTGTTTGTACTTLTGVTTVINAHPLLGGDSILMKAGTNLNVANMTISSELALCGPSGYITSNCTQNVYPGKTITIGTFGGSGNCHVLAAVTTDCASITFSANGTVDFGTGFINASNVPNLITQNLRLFGNQSNAGAVTGGCVWVAPSAGCGYAIAYNAANNYYNGGPNNVAAIQNVEAQGFWKQLWIDRTPNNTFPNLGDLCNVTAQNNYLHGVARSSPIYGAVDLQVDCDDATPAASVISNYVTNIGGFSTNDPTFGQSVGGGIVFRFAYSNIVDNFNVTNFTGANTSTQCNGYGNWWYQVGGGVAKGNESHDTGPNPIPTTPGGCDNGAFDADNGVSKLIIEYNYGHETFGSSLTILTAAPNGDTSQAGGGHTVRYNIFENGTLQSIDSSGNMIEESYGGGSTNVVYAVQSYNNTIWNGYTGQAYPNNPPYLTSTGGWTYSGYCNNQGQTAYFANNVVVANDQGPAGGPGNAIVMSQVSCPVTYFNNDYATISGGTVIPYWYQVYGSSNVFNTLAQWVTLSGETGAQTVVPGFASAGGAGTACYATGGGIPTQPGLTPCPAGYKLTTGAPTVNAGKDLSQAPINLYTTTLDYYGNTIPYTGHGGSGTNMGADGGFH
jgi:hypothetical protein